MKGDKRKWIAGFLLGVMSLGIGVLGILVAQLIEMEK